VSTVPAEEVARLYRRYDDFAALLRRRDPEGKFRNDVVDRLFPR
jgi:xylitol oxidase